MSQRILWKKRTAKSAESSRWTIGLVAALWIGVAEPGLAEVEPAKQPKIDVGDPAKQLWSPHRISDPSVLANLNPIFLRIGLGVIQEDEKLLRECAAELDQQGAAKESNKIPAGLAKLVIFEKLPDQAAYAQQVAIISSWERSRIEDATTVSSRMRQYFTDLIAAEHSDWLDSAVKAAGPTLWAGGDGFTVEITGRYLDQLSGYPAKAAYISRVTDQARSLARDEKYPADLREFWSSGRQDLAKLAVELYAAHFQMPEMWRELELYLDDFGANSKHSHHLFGLAINTLNRARSQKVDFDPRTVPGRDWFDTWHEKLKEGGSAKAAKRLSDVWAVFDAWKDEPLPLGRVAAADLIHDPQLRASFVGQFAAPTLRVVLEQATSDTTVSLRIGPTTDPDLIVASAINFSGPLHSAMRIMAELKTVRGEWERTAEGYVLHSSQKNPPEGAFQIATQSSTARLVLVGINLVVVGLVLRWLLMRRRTVAGAAHSPVGSQPTSSSETGTK